MPEDDVHIVKGIPPAGPMLNVSVGKLIYDQLVKHCVDDEAVIDAATGQSLSYKQILSKTCSLAESLKEAGYNSSTFIAICSENSIEFFLPVISAFYIGATVVPLNHTYTQSELIHAMNIAKPEVVFCSKLTYSKFKVLTKTLRYIKRVIIIDNESNIEGFECMETFIIKHLKTKEPLYTFDLAEVNLDTHIAFIMYSSGTTGLAKGVMITHRNCMVRFTHADDGRIFPQELGRCTFGLLPFFHAYGLYVGLGAIYKWTKLIVIKRFEEKLFLSCIEKYKITSLPLVPPLAVLLAKSPLVPKYDLSSVKHVACGAAPLSKETEELLKQRLKVKEVRQGYGLTETTLSVTGFTLSDEKNGSAGRVFPYITCKVRDPETGKSLPSNQVGEFCAKGPCVMKGYYGDEEATRNSFTSDGWLLTGDLAYYDDEGYFYIVGRLKELIKYKGFQVPPAELEAILLTNPKIKEAAVVGLPDEEAGELPLAFIVRDAKSGLTEKEVQEFLAAKVSSHKRLRGGVLFIDEIPKNASGKILRRKLHEMLKQRYKAKL